MKNKNENKNKAEIKITKKYIKNIKKSTSLCF